MRVMKFIGLIAVLLVASTFALAQNNAPDTSTTVKHIPITNISPTDAKEMFKSYCAVCHGTDAKGGGPAASALKTPPADLTLLARKDGGKYPAAHVAAVLRGQTDITSHGNKEMPVWGELFSSISQGHDSQVQQRVSNLVDYVESLQAK
jgi:mono/diheme cytochrome c family protein